MSTIQKEIRFQLFVEGSISWNVLVAGRERWTRDGGDMVCPLNGQLWWPSLVLRSSATDLKWERVHMNLRWLLSYEVRSYKITITITTTITFLRCKQGRMFVCPLIIVNQTNVYTVHVHCLLLCCTVYTVQHSNKQCIDIAKYE